MAGSYHAGHWMEPFWLTAGSSGANIATSVIGFSVQASQKHPIRVRVRAGAGCIGVDDDHEGRTH